MLFLFLQTAENRTSKSMDSDKEENNPILDEKEEPSTIQSQFSAEDRQIKLENQIYKQDSRLLKEGQCSRLSGEETGGRRWSDAVVGGPWHGSTLLVAKPKNPSPTSVMGVLGTPVFLVLLAANATSFISYANFTILLPAYALELEYDKARTKKIIIINFLKFKLEV